MKISKSLLGAIMVGVSLTATSCEFLAKTDDPATKDTTVKNPPKCGNGNSGNIRNCNLCGMG
jgi:hypothetical protein